jgi:hypothetical protein
MRLAVLLLAGLQLACLEAPPDAAGGGPPACSRFGSWSDAISVMPGAYAFGPTVTRDEQLMLYEAGGGEIGIADRLGDVFYDGDPSVLDGVNSEEDERNPTLSIDGLTVWFTRGSPEDTALYVSHRDRLDQAFPPATPVSGLEGLPVEGPDVWDGGLELVFSLANPSDHDLFRATCSALDVCAAAGAISEGDDGDEWYPTVRGDGLEIIYMEADGSLVAAGRDTTEGSYEVDDPLEFDGVDPELSADGSSLYYSVGGDIKLTTRPCLD